MKQRLPGLFCLLLALVVCIAVAARQDNAGTARFVRQNQQPLTALAEEVLDVGIDSGFSYPGVNSIHYTPYMEGGTLYRPCVEFFTDTAIGYAGFYYSPTDIPIPFQGISDAELIPTAFGWSWEYMGNHGTTTKITDRWYTFEAHL